MATVTQRGLGKGLSALISENCMQPPAAARPTAETAAGGVYTLSASKLHPGKFQPRTQFDEVAMAELAESIRKNGLMQPIIVRPSQSQTGKYEIIAGERRARAAQMAGIDQLPVIIREIADKQALELALVENIQRKDLSPLEEAGGYQRLVEEFGYGLEELSSTIGKSRSHIANLMRLLSLPEEIRAMLDSGELTAGHARAIIGVPGNIEVAREIVRRGLSVRQTERLSRQAQGVEKRTVIRRTKSGEYPVAAERNPDIMALEATLSDNLGLKVSINDRGSSGEIVISYDTLNQLDEILKRLSDGI